MRNQFIKNGKYWSIGGSLLLLLICYQLAFKKTWEVLMINQKLKATIASASDLSQQPKFLIRKLKDINQTLLRYRSDSTSLRAATLTAIAAIAIQNQVKLNEVPLEDPSFHNNQFIIQQLTLSGDYVGLMKTLNALEATKNIGVIHSLSIRKDKLNSLSEVSKTSLELFLQSSR